MARLQLAQPMYNLVKRQAEVEILPMAQANGIGVIPYSPAAAGLLSGKYLGGSNAGGNSGRLKSNKMYEARYGDEWMVEVAEKFVNFCKQSALHPVSTAIAWVGAHPAVTAPIVGFTKPHHLDDALASLDIALTADEVQRLEAPYGYAFSTCRAMTIFITSVAPSVMRYDRCWRHMRSMGRSVVRPMPP